MGDEWLPPQAKRGTPQVVTVALSQASWGCGALWRKQVKEAGEGRSAASSDGRAVTGKSKG